MNYGATLRIRLEKLDGHGNVLKADTVSLFKQPFHNSNRWFVRRGGRKSKVVADVTTTEFLTTLGKWIRAWLVLCVLFLPACSQEPAGHWEYEAIQTSCPEHSLLGSGGKVVRRTWVIGAGN